MEEDVEAKETIFSLSCLWIWWFNTAIETLRETVLVIPVSGPKERGGSFALINDVGAEVSLDFALLKFSIWIRIKYIINVVMLYIILTCICLQCHYPTGLEPDPTIYTSSVLAMWYTLEVTGAFMLSLNFWRFCRPGALEDPRYGASGSLSTLIKKQCKCGASWDESLPSEHMWCWSDPRGWESKGASNRVSKTETLAHIAVSLETFPCYIQPYLMVSHTCGLWSSGSHRLRTQHCF